MHPRIGPSRCGELADLIVDEQGIHTRDGGPHITRPAAGDAIGYRWCRDSFTAEPTGSASQVSVGDLRDNPHLCVETDQRNIALVRIDQTSVNSLHQLAEITINFTVWPA